MVAVLGLGEVDSCSSLLDLLQLKTVKAVLVVMLRNLSSDNHKQCPDDYIYPDELDTVYKGSLVDTQRKVLALRFKNEAHFSLKLVKNQRINMLMESSIFGL